MLLAGRDVLTMVVTSARSFDPPAAMVVVRNPPRFPRRFSVRKSGAGVATGCKSRRDLLTTTIVWSRGRCVVLEHKAIVEQHKQNYGNQAHYSPAHSRWERHNGLYCQPTTLSNQEVDETYEVPEFPVVCDQFHTSFLIRWPQIGELSKFTRERMPYRLALRRSNPRLGGRSRGRNQSLRIA